MFIWLLDVLLGDTQALTMPERFYQRALSADSDEIIAGARDFLKRNSFANYCDLVLLPALHLARIDLQSGAITMDQQIKVRGAMVAVIALRRRFAKACIVAVFLPGMLLQPDSGIDSLQGADKSASSLGHAVQICLDMHHAAAQ